MRRLNCVRQSTTPDLQVLVATTKRTYNAGETIEGAVTVAISQRTEALKALRVMVMGTEWATTKWSDHHYSEHRDFFELDVPIASLLGEVLGIGTHRWAFSARLPADLPSTMKAGNRCFWEVEYSVKAVLERSGRGASSRRRAADEATAPIRVISAPLREPSSLEPPSSCSSTTITMRKCLCNVQGRVSLGCRVTSTVVRRGEAFEVAVAVLNASSLSIGTAKLKVHLLQQAKWTAENVSATEKEVLAGQVLRNPESCCLETPQQGGRGGRYVRFDEFAEAASRSLSMALAEGKGRRFSLAVPLDVAAETGDVEAKGSPHLKLVSSLQHSIRVRLETEFLMSNVELHCPVLVLGNAPDASTTPCHGPLTVAIEASGESGVMTPFLGEDIRPACNGTTQAR